MRIDIDDQSIAAMFSTDPAIVANPEQDIDYLLR